MRAIIKPSALSGKVFSPPSKSYAHRILICAALAEGTSKISNLAESQDILATEDCINALGA
ncbi:MAG TPA: 3-phosphoshikimate 1-carboxyvinyltransferase, partial [Clostridiales bacterium]|nr:3-phosphoshikimate 1-carboxyvinyltransferase [Clostridiales bacterium]